MSHCFPSLIELASKLNKVLNRTKISQLYLATDNKIKVTQLAKLIQFGTVKIWDDPKLQGDAEAIAEQIVCANATLFVGNRWSTYSAFIAMQRKLNSSVML
jgi:hypothetical protein